MVVQKLICKEWMNEILLEVTLASFSGDRICYFQKKSIKLMWQLFPVIVGNI